MELGLGRYPLEAAREAAAGGVEPGAGRVYEEGLEPVPARVAEVDPGGLEPPG